MLRELTMEEVSFVSGGVEIVVIGSSTISGSVAISQFLDEMSAWSSIQYNATNAMQDADAADNYGEEVFDEEIIVNGATRNDTASSGDEVYLERVYLRMYGGGYGNAEQNPDGTWSLMTSLLPTPDQARYEANRNATDTALMRSLIPSGEARADLAIALTDRGLNMTGQNLAALYQEYRISSSAGSGLTGFINWIENRISQPPLGN